MHGFYGLHLNRIIGIQGINYIYLNSRSLLVEGPHQKRTLAVAKYAKLCWRVYRYLPSNNRKQLDVLHLENIQCSPLVAGNILIQRCTTVWLFVSLFLLLPSTVFPLLRFLIVFFKYTSVQQKQDHFIHPPLFPLKSSFKEESQPELLMKQITTKLAGAQSPPCCSLAGQKSRENGCPLLADWSSSFDTIARDCSSRSAQPSKIMVFLQILLG